MSGSGSVACDVTIMSGYTTATLISAYTYNEDYTPTVTSVQPERGGTAGGTLITIRGSNFG